MSSPDNQAPHEAPVATRRTERISANFRLKAENIVQESSPSSNTPSDRNSNSASPGISRSGRSIKLKSPRNMPDASSPRISGTPKSRKQGSPIENGDGSMSDTLENGTSSPPLRSLTTKVPKDSNHVTSLETVCSWVLGQLAWARVGTFPFWPCVVTPEPGTMIYYKERTVGRTQKMMIHVQYFGDNERHSWVLSTYMIPYIGLADFQRLSNSITPLDRKKDQKYAAAFLVKPGIKAKWDRAVAEATEVLSMTNDERAKVFKPKVNVPKHKSPKTPKIVLKLKSSKRKLPLDNSGGPPAKQAKQDMNNSSIESDDRSDKPKSRKQKRYENGKIDVSLGSANTPPTPPSSHKDSSDEAPLRSQPKLKVKKLKKPTTDEDFQNYFERNRDRIEDELPDASEAEIRKYLKKNWDNMKGAVRSTFQIRLKQNSQGEEESSSEEETAVVTDASLYSDSTPPTTKKSKSKIDEKLDTTPVAAEGVSTKKKRPFNLFKGMKQERVCQICEKTDNLTRCRGPCYSYFHLSCVKPTGESSPEHSFSDVVTMDNGILQDLKEIKDNTVDDVDDNAREDDYNEGKEAVKNEEPSEEEETFRCIDCLSGVAPACFICNGREGERIRCSVSACGKHYHSACLKPWPQSHWQGGRLSCPYHICHTCSSDNPRDSHPRAPNEKMARCVRCPSSYHSSSSCLPAGSIILTGSQIICPKHHKSTQPPINAAWCFLCTRGGSLICCDTCPTSFHPECLGIDAPDGAFICEDCETGRLPLYGEVVWVKLGVYRWWPSRICYPHEVPQNVAAIAHSPGEFCVMFLGTKDYYWVHRGRAFLYQDGDAANTKGSAGRKQVDEAYRRALEEANDIHQRLKTEKAAAKDGGPRGLKPPPYIKLKVNKPVGNVKPTEVDSIAACDCEADGDNPCAPESDCLNRILSVECSPGICPAGSNCKNQAFVRRQYPAMEPFHTAGRGWGLRALEQIKSGQFVIEYVGEVIDEAEYRRRLHRKKELKDENFYFLTIDNYRMIDAEPKGNLSRFMNHSCQPNCETQKWTVNGDTRIGLFALRDIETGEELTFNYNLVCDGETRKPCLCGAPNCSGFIGLKAQKQVQQVLNTTQERKMDKMEKVKRQKRSGRVTACWTCGEEISRSSGTIVKCAQKTCNKRYHKSCVTVEDAVSRFSCPWHHCAVCGRRTSAHCSFCSNAFCQVHIDGKLAESGDKGALICQAHENLDSQKSLLTEYEKEDSDNETETEKEDSTTGTESGSPILPDRPPLPRMPSPRVSIVEVILSSEEGEESQKEEEEEDEVSTERYMANGIRVGVCEPRKKTQISRRLSLRMRREEETTKILNSLTSSQLEAIIGTTNMIDPSPSQAIGTLG